MKQGFEKDLQGFSSIAKEEQGGFRVSKDVEKFQHVLDWYLKKATERQRTYPGYQERIYELQKEKQDIMSRLDNWLSCIDNPECKPEQEDNTRKTTYDSQKGLFGYILEDGRELEATFGEIMTDMEWGILYSLDKESVPRDMLKKYLVERTKHDLKKLLDSQIITSETGRMDIKDKWISDTYKKVGEMLESSDKTTRPGFIAESMVKNILRKMQYDINVDFEIIDADVHQDIEQKIDLVIHRTNKNRGVEVTVEDGRYDIGIQFTTNINPEVTAKKKSQIEKAKRKITSEWHIDDLVLVSFPLGTTSKVFQQWNQDGQPAGGPDRYLDRVSAKKLFHKLMVDVFPQDQIDKYWSEFENYFTSKSDDTKENLDK